MTAALTGPTTNCITSFLTEIGIVLTWANLPDETFLPGIQVFDGTLLVDESKLKYPGDLLHEAGHLAVVPADARPHLNDEVTWPDQNADLIEAAAICWSYAACVHLGLDPQIVFHKDGYLGRSEGLLLNFQMQVYPGAVALEAAGMTYTVNNAEKLGFEPFPAMRKWLRD